MSGARTSHPAHIWFAPSAFVHAVCAGRVIIKLLTSKVKVQRPKASYSTRARRRHWRLRARIGLLARHSHSAGMACDPLMMKPMLVARMPSWTGECGRSQRINDPCQSSACQTTRASCEPRGSFKCSGRSKSGGRGADDPGRALVTAQQSLQMRGRKEAGRGAARVPMFISTSRLGAEHAKRTQHGQRTSGPICTEGAPQGGPFICPELPGGVMQCFAQYFSLEPNATQSTIRIL